MLESLKDANPHIVSQMGLKVTLPHPDTLKGIALALERLSVKSNVSRRPEKNTKRRVIVHKPSIKQHGETKRGSRIKSKKP